MNTLDIIVPIRNEEQNITKLIKRIDQSLRTAKIAYRVICIDDHSTDNSAKIIRSLANKFPITYALKKGKRGKAYSILEGAAYAKSENIAMIDGDCQYPPEAMPQMFKLLKENGMVIGKREKYQASFLRKTASKVFKGIFTKVLFNLDYDVQSGLKVFKKEILEQLSEKDVSGWTLDLPLIYSAQKLGYSIAEVSIKFAAREFGESKINIVKSSLEIGSQAFKLKTKSKKVIPIKPTSTNSMVGAGMIHNNKRYITHSTLHPDISAVITFTTIQKLLATLFVGVIAFGIWRNALFTAQVCIGVLSFIYFFDSVFNFFIIYRSLHKQVEYSFGEEELKKLDDKNLPIYTILCPLYREAQVLPNFLKAISALDWPKNKLDVQLLLEEDDVETIEAARKMKLPNYFRILVVPHSFPKTKPKACNYGLNFAKGEYLVIYDAEDIPDPLQLKKAYLGYQKAPANIACLQAKLNYFNPHQNLLTRLFTAEYSLWFDLILPGLQLVGTTIPLGGTSNHFRVKELQKLGGWDPFNVTEDCDLGTRLFMEGKKTAIIDSTTYEEANSRYRNWLRQRSRWIKGYMQTYLVHMRDPWTLIKKQGFHALLFQLIVGFKTAFLFINPFLWLVTLGYFILNAHFKSFVEGMYPSFIFYMAVVSFVFGNFIFAYNYMIGCIKREQYSLIKFVFLIPLYWLMASIAALIALQQLIFKPHYWEKTVHGFHLQKASQEKKQQKAGLSLPQKPAFPSFPGFLPRPNWIFVGCLIAGLILIPVGVFGQEHLFPSASVHPGSNIFLTLSIIFASISFISFVVLMNGFFGGSPKKMMTALSANYQDLLSLFSFKAPKKDHSKTRILIFNWRDITHKWAGGAENYIHEIAKRWVKQGIEVTIFCGNDGTQKRCETIDGIKVVRRGGVYMVYIWAFLYYMFQFRKSYDLVIDCENGIPFFTPFYVRIPKILLIHHIHQEVFRERLRFPLSAIGRVLESKIMPALYKSQTIVTVSNSSKKEIERLQMAAKESVHVVNPGIDVRSTFTSAKTKNPTFLYLGRITKWKKLDIAILALAEVSKTYPNTKLIIAGYGEALPQLRKMVTKQGLDDKVEFLGKVSEQKKKQLFAKSWVALQPSMLEGWGITVIEANAFGTPVIASKVNGLTDSVKNNQTGILVEQGDPHLMAQEMKRMINDLRLRKRLSKGAFEWSKQFSWQKSAQQFYLIIAEKTTDNKPTVTLSPEFAAQ